MRILSLIFSAQCEHLPLKSQKGVGMRIIKKKNQCLTSSFPPFPLPINSPSIKNMEIAADISGWGQALGGGEIEQERERTHGHG